MEMGYEHNGFVCSDLQREWLKNDLLSSSLFFQGQEAQTSVNKGIDIKPKIMVLRERGRDM